MSDKKDYFDEKASQWDNLLHEDVWQRLKEMILALEIPQGSEVLDLGTGTGVIVPMLIEAVGPSGRVVAMDFAARMLAEAQRKFQYPNLEFIEGAAEQIPLNDQVFDEVVCNSAFPHFENLQQAAQEMARVLKKGGRITIMHPHSRDHINYLHVSLGGAVRNCLLPEEEEMKAIFSEAGFKDIFFEDVTNCYRLIGRKG